jgi:hypothetical protein
MAVKSTVATERVCDFCGPPDREGHPYVLCAPVQNYKFDMCEPCLSTVTLAQVQKKIAARPGGAVHGTAAYPYRLKLGNQLAAERQG